MEARTIPKKKTRIWIGVIGVLILALVAYFNQYEPWLWERNHRVTSVRVLSEAAANGTNGLRGAVGKLGLLLVLRNGDWIAICYNDRHGGGIQSLSIALDSEGKWFESRRHFCGQFIGYSIDLERLETDRRLAITHPTEEHRLWAEKSRSKLIEHPLCGLLYAANTASNLTGARPHLEQLGFREFVPAQSPRP